jgi:hypothetical protein
MLKTSVVDSVLSPSWLSWLKKRKNIISEIERQVIQEIEVPGSGLTLDQLQLVTEHKNPWSTVVAKAKRASRSARTKLLAFLKRFKVAGNEHFVATDHFTHGNEAGVKFWDFGSNFKANFLGKVEPSVPAGFLKSYHLKQNSLDGPIREELGDRPETFLSDFWELLAKQPNGEDGQLLTNGAANIFYIRDANGKLWAVGASWSGADGGWCVDADSVGSPSPWSAGRRVFSR